MPRLLTVSLVYGFTVEPAVAVSLTFGELLFVGQAAAVEDVRPRAADNES